MGERRVRNAKVGGSIPPGSTKYVLFINALKIHSHQFWCGFVLFCARMVAIMVAIPPGVGGVLEPGSRFITTL